MELFYGRPEDCSGRLARETRVYDYLDGLGVEYLRTDHFDMPAAISPSGRRSSRRSWA